jgi:hypothetical protein
MGRSLSDKALCVKHQCEVIVSLTWRVEWNKLSKLISSFLEARQFYSNGSDNSPFTHGRHQLTSTSKAIIKELEKFLERHRAMLPQEATQSLEGFLGLAWSGVLGAKHLALRTG